MSVRRRWGTALGWSRGAGYVAAVVVPVAITLLVAWLRLPAFVFEHLIVLLVLAFAIPWGVRVAVVAALVAVLADNVLLHEPIGQPAITGYRDVLDLLLYAAVAVAVGGLVAKARQERATAERAAERERAAREERDRLIATISHDLATPLAVLGGTLQAARRIGSGATLDLSRLLVRLETATARATALVKTLADARAIDADGLALRPEAVDLRGLVLPIAEMLDRLSDRHPVICALPERPVMVLADGDRLQRVVENLVNNAIKYSPDGGTVEVTLTADDDAAILKVRDYGIGISPEALPRIFERSYRAPEAVATAPGLGLGLNISVQIVGRHGGTMEVRNVEPRGAEMTLRLPLLVTEPSAGRAAGHAPQDEGEHAFGAGPGQGHGGRHHGHGE